MQVAALVPNGRGGLYPGRIAIEGGRVSGVQLHRDTGSPEVDLDLRPHVALPGFMDLQINGAFGHDITSAPESMWPIGSQLPRNGVTAFLPTVITSPARQRQGAYRAMAARPAGYAGAVPLGLHVEGPALLPNRAGGSPGWGACRRHSRPGGRARGLSSHRRPRHPRARTAQRGVLHRATRGPRESSSHSGTQEPPRPRRPTRSGRARPRSPTSSTGWPRCTTGSLVPWALPCCIPPPASR